jgi:hypothetical protein
MATCRSCEAEITWGVVTPSLRRIPLDLKPVPDGNVIIDGGGTARVLRAGEDAPEGALRYRTHYATCPNAAQHRHAKPKPAPATPTLF